MSSLPLAANMATAYAAARARTDGPARYVSLRLYVACLGLLAIIEAKGHEARLTNGGTR